MSLGTGPKSDAYFPDGLRKWDEKEFPQTNRNPDGSLTPTNATPPSKLVNFINSCNIKTDIINVSLKVENDNLELLFHVFLNEIVSWDVNNEILTLNTSDEVTTVFTLLSSDDAIIASNRIDKILNGEDVQICDDINNDDFCAIIEENDPFIMTETNSYIVEENCPT